jgi:hypothetical protein
MVEVAGFIAQLSQGMRNQRKNINLFLENHKEFR